MNIEKIGIYIKELRQSKNLTQEQLANEIFVSNKAISRWETGKSLPEIETLYLLSKALGVSVNDILEAGNNKESEVKKYFDKKKNKQIIFNTIILIILLSYPIIQMMINGPFLIDALLGYFSQIDNQELFITAHNESYDILMSSIGNFIVSWILIIISYMGFNLKNKNALYCVIAMCFLIILYVMLCPGALINSSICYVVIILFNLLFLKILKIK